MIRPVRWFVLTVLLGLAFSACGSETGNQVPTPAPSKQLTRADLGNRWPLTVDQITLHCEGASPDEYVTFDANGQTYALNGRARDVENGKGWHDLSEVWTTDGMGGHVAAYDLVSKGLALCGS